MKKKSLFVTKSWEVTKSIYFQTLLELFPAPCEWGVVSHRNLRRLLKCNTGFTHRHVWDEDSTSFLSAGVTIATSLWCWWPGKLCAFMLSLRYPVTSPSLFLAFFWSIDAGVYMNKLFEYKRRQLTSVSSLMQPVKSGIYKNEYVWHLFLRWHIEIKSPHFEMFCQSPVYCKLSKSSSVSVVWPLRL